jgi:hypothetical protein
VPTETYSRISPIPLSDRNPEGYDGNRSHGRSISRTKRRDNNGPSIERDDAGQHQYSDRDHPDDGGYLDLSLQDFPVILMTSVICYRMIFIITSMIPRHLTSNPTCTHRL